MMLFILAAAMALGGYAITIPLLIHDEWVQWRRRRRAQKTLLLEKQTRLTGILKWNTVTAT